MDVNSILDGTVWALRWAVTLFTFGVWVWVLRYNFTLSTRFLAGESVRFRPIPIIGMICGIFVVFSCPAFVEMDHLPGFPEGSRRIPLALVATFAECWVPFGLIGVLMGRQSAMPDR